MLLGIYGSGGAGREVRDIAEESGRWDQIVFIDDTVSEDIYKGIQRMPFDRFVESYSPAYAQVIISLGEPIHKVALYNKIVSKGYSAPIIAHKSAWISPSAHVGNGVVLRAGVVVNADSYVGDNVTIQEHSCVGHDAHIGNHCQIAGMVVIGGHATIGEATYIGLNVPIKDRVSIGSHSIIGMGSAVIRDIPDNVIALGNPARVMKTCDENTRVFS